MWTKKNQSLIQDDGRVHQHVFPASTDLALITIKLVALLWSSSHIQVLVSDRECLRSVLIPSLNLSRANCYIRLHTNHLDLSLTSNAGSSCFNFRIRSTIQLCGLASRFRLLETCPGWRIERISVDQHRQSALSVVVCSTRGSRMFSSQLSVAVLSVSKRRSTWSAAVSPVNLLIVFW